LKNNSSALKYPRANSKNRGGKMKKIILLCLSIVFFVSCSKKEDKDEKKTNTISDYKPLREITRSFNNDTQGGKLLLEMTELPAINDWVWTIESINKAKAKLFTKNKGVCFNAFIYSSSNSISIVSYEGWPGQVKERNARIIQAAKLLNISEIGMKRLENILESFPPGYHEKQIHEIFFSFLAKNGFAHAYKKILQERLKERNNALNEEIMLGIMLDKKWNLIIKLNPNSITDEKQKTRAVEFDITTGFEGCKPLKQCQDGKGNRIAYPVFNPFNVQSQK
jgi:hypothetical protein